MALRVQLLKGARPFMARFVRPGRRGSTTFRNLDNKSPLRSYGTYGLAPSTTKAEEEVLYKVRSKGWQNDPVQETWPLSDLDYTMPPVFLKTMLVYRVNDASKRDDIIHKLKDGLATTLTQYRTLNTVFKKENGEVTLVRTRGRAIPFIVHSSTRNNEIGTFSDLQNTGFHPSELSKQIETKGITGYPTTRSVLQTITTDRPAAEFQVTWLSGGLILTFGFNHYCIDGGGMSAFMDQWARNTIQLTNGAATPPTPMAHHNSDRDRLSGVRLSVDQRVLSPAIRQKSVEPLAQTHASRPVVLHLKRSGLEKVKEAAASKHGLISTYDTVSAFIWQTMTRARMKIYTPIDGETTVLAQAVDLRSKFQPPLSLSYQGNAVMGVLTRPVPVADAVVGGNLPHLSSIIRQAHNGITEQKARDLVSYVSKLKDKTSAAWSGAGAPRFSTAITDRRNTSHYALDFGFGTPYAVRNVYQPHLPCTVRKPPLHGNGHQPDDPDGPVLELEVPIEIGCLEHLIRDPQVSEYCKVVCV